jgi:exonuclease SbcD
MKILHTADWHLGRIFYETYLTDDQAHCLEQIISFAIDAKPDVFLITGDIFDRAIPPPEAIKLLDDTIHKITTDVQCKIIIIAGNHDSPERLSFGSRIFSSQGIFIHGTIDKHISPIVIHDRFGPVHFFPLPYSEPPRIRALFQDESIKSHNDAFAKITGCIIEKSPPHLTRTVLCSHASILGGDISDSERPLSIGGAETINAELLQGFTFTALGHLHRSQCIGNRINYSGSLMKYSFSEVNHQKSFSMIDIDKTGNIQIERIPITPKHDLKIIEDTLEEIISGKYGISNKYDYYMISLTNKEPQLDAIGKLRTIYPNVLHIERPELFKMQNVSSGGIDHRKLTDKDLFETFYQQTTGDSMNAEQIQYLQQLIDSITVEEREA